MNPANPTFHPLERAELLHEGYLRAFDVGGLHLVLVQQGGVPAVLEGYCPHAGHPLEGSRLGAQVYAASRRRANPAWGRGSLAR